MSLPARTANVGRQKLAVLPVGDLVIGPENLDANEVGHGADLLL